MAAIAGQAKTYVVLGQHDRAYALPVLGFVLADPEKFGEREVGESRIRGELDDSLRADLAVQFAALVLGAHVAPDQSRTHHPVLIIEHDRAMHLAGESDAGNVIGAEARLGQGFANRQPAGPPPVFRLLLGPANFRRSEWGMFLGGRGRHPALFVEDQRACAARADVDA